MNEVEISEAWRAAASIGMLAVLVAIVVWELFGACDDAEQDAG